MLPDYFKTYLQTYLSDHGFEPGSMVNPIVLNNIESAENEFETARKAGHTVDGAMEIAINELFVGIGDSKREVLSEILINNFGEKLELNKDVRILELWVKRLSENDTITEDFKLENGLGLDPEILEGSKEKLIARIDQYLTIHGIQQKENP